MVKKYLPATKHVKKILLSFFIISMPLIGVSVNASAASKADNLEEQFMNPPESAKPHTWWHFMNNNISKEGVKADLDAMKDVGIGGFQLFQAGTGIPMGKVPYGSEEWADIINYAGELAEEYGLEMGMHNCPGWSSTGGPWMDERPDLSMQQLVWSEAHVSVTDQNSLVNIQLPRPFTRINYYKDAILLAFPSVKGEKTSYQDNLIRVTCNDRPVDVNLLTDYDFSTGVEIKPANEGQKAHLLLEFLEPYEGQSIEIYGSVLAPGGLFGDSAAATIILEASDDGVTFEKISDISSPGAGSKDSTGVIVPGFASFGPVTAKYFRVSSDSPLEITQLRLSGAPIINDWIYKTNHESAPPHRWNVDFKPLKATQEVSSDYMIDPDSVIDITEYMDENGRLTWNAPQGDWTILRFGHTSLAVENGPAPEGASGLEIDKFSTEAFDYHFEHMFAEILPMLERLGNKGLANLTIDSYEKGVQTWTPRFPQEFEARRGYDIYGYLPAMTGRIVGSGSETDRFLYDVRLTHSDLMSDNYYGYFTTLCNRYGIRSNAESYSYGRTLFDDLQASSRVDVPVAEFPILGGGGFERQVKLLASAAHLYGKRKVGAEAFTGVPALSKWQEHPYYLKSYGDVMMTLGLNQVIFHTFAHQPNTDPDVVPGMTMGQWGIYMNRNNTWFSQARGYMTYLARAQYMLQQGSYVADLLYFSGKDAPGYVPSYRTLTDSIPYGYGYDAVNMETILDELKVEKGRVTTSSGMSYRVLVLPEDLDVMKLDLLTKIRDLVTQGMVLVGPKPSASPSLSDLGREDEWKAVADELWGDLDGTTANRRSLGSGLVYWGVSVADVLNGLGIRPDFHFTAAAADAPIGYIHHRIQDADAYFVANRERTAHDIVATFRIEGKLPEFWNPETGQITPVQVYDLVEGGVRVPMHLDPAQSMFVVFRKPAPEQHLVSAAKDGITVAGTKPYDVPEKGLYRGIKNSFSISVWVKPETNIMVPGTNPGFLGADGPGSDPGYVFYPPEGEEVYGTGHAACGLAVGRNGIILYERAAGAAKTVLSVPAPVSGWSLISVVYNNGTPSLYLNGEQVARGEKSPYMVHPGANEHYPVENATYFTGNMGEPEVYSHAVSEDEIKALSETPIPAPPAPPAIETAWKSGELLVWQNGDYLFTDNTGGTSTLQITQVGAPREIGGQWTVTFPPKRGAPEEITMDELISWTEHPDDGVKYFSGTATYSNQFSVSSEDRAENKRLYLDLGWVDNIARVRVNGHDLGILWTQPFRVDITDVVHEGNNDLEVEVTNVWVNRLIGDERFPSPYTYSGEGITEIPEWYSNNETKPADGRVTFTTWDHHDAGDALLSSGLLGPVKLINGVQIETQSQY